MDNYTITIKYVGYFITFFKSKIEYNTNN